MNHREDRARVLQDAALELAVGDFDGRTPSAETVVEKTWTDAGISEIVRVMGTEDVTAFTEETVMRVATGRGIVLEAGTVTAIMTTVVEVQTGLDRLDETTAIPRTGSIPRRRRRESPRLLRLLLQELARK